MATIMGLLGGSASKTASTTITVTNSSGAVIPAGTVIHIVGCWDNINVTAPTITCSTVGGATATANHATPVGQGVTTTAGAGIWHQCFRVLTTAAIAVGATIATLTSNQNASAQAAAAVGYNGVTATLRGTVATGASATGSPSVATAGTAPVAGDLVIASVSFENFAQMTADTDTVNGSWSPIVGAFTNIGGWATNVGVGLQSKIVTADGVQMFDPTGGTGDTVACVYAVQSDVKKGTATGTVTWDGLGKSSGQRASNATSSSAFNFVGTAIGKSDSQGNVEWKIREFDISAEGQATFPSQFAAPPTAPTIVGTPATAFNVAGTTLTFSKPAGLANGDYLVAVCRSQNPTSTNDFTCTGFTRGPGPAFVANSSTNRVQGFYTKKVTDAPNEPASYVFDVGGITQRLAGTLFVVRGVHTTTPMFGPGSTYGGDGIANGRRITAYSTGFTNPGLILFTGGAEFTSPNSHIPTSTPSGYTQVSLATTSSNTTISRTAVWTGAIIDSTGTTTNADITWAVLSGQYGGGLALQGADPANAGTSTGAISLVGSATGKQTPKASSAGNLNFVGFTVGNRTPVATVTGALNFVGSAIGKKTPKATAAGTLTYAGTAVGTRPGVDTKAGSASGTVTWSGTAIGRRVPKGTATGALSFTGSAVGGQPATAKTGSAAGTVNWVGAATGRKTTKGTVVGAITFTGTATGRARDYHFQATVVYVVAEVHSTVNLNTVSIRRRVLPTPVIRTWDGQSWQPPPVPVVPPGGTTDANGRTQLVGVTRHIAAAPIKKWDGSKWLTLWTPP